MFGWTGKVLRVDLTNLSSSVEDLDRRAAEQYIGPAPGRPPATATWWSLSRP